MSPIGLLMDASGLLLGPSGLLMSPSGVLFGTSRLLRGPSGHLLVLVDTYWVLLVTLSVLVDS